MPLCISNGTIASLIVKLTGPYSLTPRDHDELIAGLLELLRQRRWAKKMTAKVAALEEHHNQHHAALDNRLRYDDAQGKAAGL